MRAGLYVRLSKEDEKGKLAGIDSIAVQTADGREAISSQGWDFQDKHLFVDDDVSGRAIKRDGWSGMLQAASRGEFSILVMRDLDRFARYEPARQMATLIDLFDRGVRVWTYKDRNFVKLAGPESIVTYARAIASEQYVEALRTNITAGLRRRVLEGRAVKQPPLGYRIEDQGSAGKRWVFEPDEVGKVLHVGKLFVELRSLNGTAAKLNEEGIRAPEGGMWRSFGVRKILTRPLYRGFYTHADLVIPHPELRIWTPEMEAQIDQILAKPTKPWGRTPRHLSTRFVRCGVCGGSLVATSSQRSKYASLVCDRQRSKACSGIGYRSEPAVDQAVVAAVGLAVTDEIWVRTKQLLRDALNAQRNADEQEAEIDRLRRDVQTAERRVRNLTDSLAEADSSGERAVVFQALRAEAKRLELAKSGLAQAESRPTRERPESILDEAERRVMALRETLARGGVAAIPAVEAILGPEKFTATRAEGGGWQLTATVATAHLYVGSSTGEKAKIKGQLPKAPPPPASSLSQEE